MQWNHFTSQQWTLGGVWTSKEPFVVTLSSLKHLMTHNHPFVHKKLFQYIAWAMPLLYPTLIDAVPPDWSHQTHLWPKKDVFDLIGPLMCPLMPLDGPLWPTKLLQITTTVVPWLVPSPIFQTISPYCSHKTCLWPIKVIFGGPLIVQPAWLWYSQSRVATPLGMEKYRRFDFQPENVNIWPTTGQNRWWYMLRSSLVFTCFNFCHYWGQGGPFSPGDLSISSQMSWGTTMWIWADQSQRSMFFKAENCSCMCPLLWFADQKPQ